jgi:hypothetical protein
VLSGADTVEPGTDLLPSFNRAPAPANPEPAVGGSDSLLPPDPARGSQWTAEQRQHSPAIRRSTLDEPVRPPAHHGGTAFINSNSAADLKAHITLLSMSPKGSWSAAREVSSSSTPVARSTTGVNGR